MKRPNWTITILIIIILVAIFTNPSSAEHKLAVKSIINQKVQSSLSNENTNGFESLGALLGGSLINNLIDNSITSDNYLLFSITKINWKGESKNIGYGLFGNVFISKKVNDSFNDSKESQVESNIENLQSEMEEALDTTPY